MAVVSPFAQIQDSLPPLTPDPSHFDPLMGMGLSPDTAPALPSGKSKAVFAPVNPTDPTADPGLMMREHMQAKLGGDYDKDSQKPTSALGKVGHVFQEIGNAVVPGVMARIPGTELHRQSEEMGLQKSLSDLLKEQSAEAEQGANTAHLTEETKEMPAKEASAEGLQGATTRHLGDESASLENPAPVVLETDQGIFMRNPKTNELTPLTYQGKPLNPFNKVAPKGAEKVDLVGPDGKPMAADFHPDTGKYTDSTGKEIVNPRPYEKPNQSGMVTIIAPDPSNPGGGIVERVGAGAHLAPGSMTAPQFGQGAAADVKEGKADEKAVKDAQNEYKLAQNLVAHPSPTNDLALVMRYIGATKPDSLGKLRLNNNEVNLVMGTRSSFGDLEALAQKVTNGQMLTPAQRQDMLSTMKILGTAHGESKEETGTIYARDPHGVLHQAPAGTALPQGWKKEQR